MRVRFIPSFILALLAAAVFSSVAVAPPAEAASIVHRCPFSCKDAGLSRKLCRLKKVRQRCILIVKSRALQPVTPGNVTGGAAATVGGTSAGGSTATTVGTTTGGISFPTSNSTVGTQLCLTATGTLVSRPGGCNSALGEIPSAGPVPGAAVAPAAALSGATFQGVIGGTFTAGIAASWAATASLPEAVDPVLRSGDILIAPTVDLLAACGGNLNNCLPAADAAINSTLCTGTVLAPTAPPGKVCIYPQDISNAFNFVGIPVPVSGSRNGFGVLWDANAGLSSFFGTWAFTPAVQAVSAPGGTTSSVIAATPVPTVASSISAGTTPVPTATSNLTAPASSALTSGPGATSVTTFTPINAAPALSGATGSQAPSIPAQGIQLSPSLSSPTLGASLSPSLSSGTGIIAPAIVEPVVPSSTAGTAVILQGTNGSTIGTAITPGTASTLTGGVVSTGTTGSASTASQIGGSTFGTGSAQ